MAQPPLFREEARQALKVRLEGDVIAYTPPTLRRLALVLGASLLLAGLFAATATYTRYVPASGVLAPREGLVSVSAPFKGDLVDISARLGDKVRAGQRLALLRKFQPQSGGADALERDRALIASRQSLSEQLQHAKDTELDKTIEAGLARVTGARASQAAAKASLQAANAQVAVSLKYLNQQRELVRSGFMAAAGLAPAERAWLADVQLVRQAEQTLAAQEAELANAEQAVAQARSQRGALAVQRADTQAALALDASRLEASSEAVINSTLPGTVAAVAALPGPVGADTPLFVIAPDGPIYAHLLLDEAAAQKAKVGQRVTLQLASRARNDSAKLTGTLESLATAPVADGGKNGEQGYLALVRLDPAARAPLGARVEARLQVDTKSLLGWLLDPLVRGLRQSHLINL